MPFGRLWHTPRATMRTSMDSAQKLTELSRISKRGVRAMGAQVRARPQPRHYPLSLQLYGRSFLGSKQKRPTVYPASVRLR